MHKRFNGHLLLINLIPTSMLLLMYLSSISKLQWWLLYRLLKCRQSSLCAKLGLLHATASTSRGWLVHRRASEERRSELFNCGMVLIDYLLVHLNFLFHLLILSLLISAVRDGSLDWLNDRDCPSIRCLGGGGADGRPHFVGFELHTSVACRLLLVGRVWVNHR